MDLIDKIKDIASRIPKQIDYIQTEEATKTALILPFIRALGYDTSNPTEVIPESTADIGTKKGEKVDYAIKKGDDIIMLIECKWSGADLHQDHVSQLYRYFSTTDARFAILTNGIAYEFYSDLDAKNKMDSKPFFTFNVLGFQDHQVNELKKFTKSAFSLKDILTTASELKYTGAIKKILEEELTNPSKEFVKFFISKVCDRSHTKQVIEEFTPIVQEACKQFVKEKINERLKSALSANETPKEKLSPENEEEIEGYNIIKAILHQTVDVKGITMRSIKSYCRVLLDDNNKPLTICLLHFKSSQKYIGILIQKKETRFKIDSVDDIFKFTEQIKSTVAEYTDR